MVVSLVLLAVLLIYLIQGVVGLYRDRHRDKYQTSRKMRYF